MCVTTPVDHAGSFVLRTLTATQVRALAMQRIPKLLFVASVFMCLALGCAKLFKRPLYKCTSSAVVDPKSVEDYIKVASDHRAKSEFDCAYGACDEAVRLEPKNPKAYVCRARSTLDEAASLRNYAHAIELDPNFIESYIYRGGFYERNDDTDLAVKDLEIVVKLCEGQCNRLYLAETHRRLGELYMKRNDYETAVLDYTESVRLAPEIAASYSGRMAAYRKLERHELADLDRVKAVELEGSEFGAKAPEVIELGIINYRATSLPQPSYPEIALYTRPSGDVLIAVVINEAGQVVKSWGQDGPPLLQGPAIEVAKRARFKPLMVNGNAVKFSGYLQYTFAAPK
jgi:tetratricopeptide (TPR) repeat protein